LSGGSGTRLWPLSREQFPKQLLPLASRDETMLQATVSRLEGLPDLAKPIVVCNEAHRFLVAEQLRSAGVDGAEIVLEPVGRNTAPAIALAAQVAIADSNGSDPLLLVLPADHVITNAKEFRETVQRALPAARAGYLVTFGVVPQSPETGYGYIRRGSAPLSESADAFPIARFVEKPGRATAEGFLASGDYLWNAGMFLFSARRYLEELARHAPDLDAAVRAAYGSASRFDRLRRHGKDGSRRGRPARRGLE
jgi:mannose-1-phosphate guanylyltransferase/mannose-6-phosphate isomerase